MSNRPDLDFDRCYAAVESRDARFDGLFFVAVRTTGIYCRPSCPTPVRPKAANVTFFKSTAAAQLAGFRACKRCRPDAIPGSPEWDVRADLAGRAMRLIADGVVDRDGVSGLARRLAVSERHLHRVLLEAVGAPPLALARARRAQTARVLIETTDLAFSSVAYAAGFPSIRQFNDTIREVFVTTPTALRAAAARRRARGGPPPAAAGEVAVRLPVRQPFDGPALLAWLSHRHVQGVEEVRGEVYRRTLALPGGPATIALEPRVDHVAATFHLATIADLATAVARCRRLLDLDADPGAYGWVLTADPLLAPAVASSPGLRAVGSAEPAETAVRVIIGQRISVRAARSIACRLALEFGKPLDDADGTLTHLFPTAETLADADLAGMGIPAPRVAALQDLCRRVADGTLSLDPGSDRDAVRAELLAIPGIGPWTADLIALRALRDPDAFPAADLGLVRGAAALGIASDAATLELHSQRWRPWRAYAAHYLWR